MNSFCPQYKTAGASARGEPHPLAHAQLEEICIPLDTPSDSTEGTVRHDADQCPRRNSRPTCPDLTSDPCLIRQDENNPIHDDSIVASQQTVPAESLHAITQNVRERVWDREEALVKKWKDEINTLLTFAGLFSAALTAFNVQYYLALQPQSPDPTTQAVLILVGAVAASGGSTDIIQPLLAQLNASSTTTPISSHVVSINALWFSALVFSLSAASLAISVNQWLHHHIDHAASKSRQSVRVWYFRHQGFTSWHVPFIISLLPVLLQTSLALFLIGLVELLWTLNPIVAGIVTALILVLLSVSILSTFFPAVSPSCPYKSQPAWWSVLVIQHILDLILPIVERFASLTTWTWCRQFLPIPALSQRIFTWRRQNAISDWCGAQRARPRLISWQEFDDTAVRSQVENASANDTLLMLVEADATVRDDDFLRTVVRPCLQWGDLPACLPAFYRILEHRAHEVLASTDPPTLKWSRSEQDGQALIAMGHISVDIIERIAASPTSHDAGHTKHLMRILGLLLNLLHAIPQTNSTVFSRLVRLGPTIDVSDDVHDRLAQLFQLAGDRYAINTDDARLVLSSLSIVRATCTPQRFLQISSFAIRIAARLSEADFADVRGDLQDALVVVAKNFGPDAIEPTARELTTDDGWARLNDVLNACSALAQIDSAIFPPNIVTAFERCASRCPEDSRPIIYAKIKDSLARLRTQTKCLT